ncbi:MAG: PQQ-like beta-propeller repeat protein [Thermoplasmata archaeon]|nr:PQQ-like beta-propeller repeat protein [Thermoplasmata archaeon]
MDRIPPTIADDGTIYIPSEDNLYALNPNGAIKWEFNKGSRWSVVIDGDGTIYFSSDDILYAINPDGTVKWEFVAEDDIANSAAIYNDTIYFADMCGYLYALFLNGTLKWKFDMGLKSLCSPSIDENGVIYCSTNWPGTCNIIYAIYPNGTKKWEWMSPFNPLDGDTHGFAVTNDTLYFATYEGNLYALDKENGSMKWYAYLSTNYTYGKYPTLPAIGKDGTIWVACNRYDRESGPDNGYLYAFTPDGKKKYEIKLTSGEPYASVWPGSPSIGEDGTVYIATWNDWFTIAGYGYLYAINDEMKRDVFITRPKVPYLYIFDREIWRFGDKYFDLGGVASIVIGGITIEVEVESPDHVEKVEFYIEDRYSDTPPLLYYTNYSSPFQCECRYKAFDNKKEWHQFYVKAYYDDGYVVTDLVGPIRIFCLFGESP